MRYYHYEPDCSVAGLGTRALMGDQLGEIFHCNEPVASRWKPIRVQVLDEEPLEAGDFPFSTTTPAAGVQPAGLGRA